MLFHPTYFPPINQFVAMSHADKIVFEVNDFFEKQTYRNRCYIYAENGKQLLNIPIKHQKGIRQKTKDIRIDYRNRWNIQHLRALQTAYRSSPFFEFYIDDLLPIFEKQHSFLLDVNLTSHELICKALDLEVSHSFTEEYEDHPKQDFRNLAEVKQENSLERYIQVFEPKHGFIPNLSILDLLFMEGTNALNYLEKQTLL
ncbi:MAG: WbqC family protein [Flavobacteriaceae bacterium]|nr:WbqC family protein [Flavobacteriaceae bacterium]